MKKAVFILFLVVGAFGSYRSIERTDRALEPFTYNQNFETHEVSAWASYPLWQDTAYDENLQVNTIVPGDSNMALEKKVIPYSNVDTYAGVQKKLDMNMVSDSTISFRYYLKTNQSVEFFKVRLAAGSDGKVDYTVNNPPTNKWEMLSIGYNDFINENSYLAGKNLKVNALAVLAKVPDADPDMPIYLGLDDIVFKGTRRIPFKFVEPEMYKLSEWKMYIPRKHYHRDEAFTLRGYWPFNANRVSLMISSFTDRNTIFMNTNLKKLDNEWSLKEIKLQFPEGLYLATLSAFRGKEKLSNTEFTIYIAPKNIGSNHPRLWFDTEGQKRAKARIRLERFKNVKQTVLSKAGELREKMPLQDVTFNIDQFPEEDWAPTLSAWFKNIYGWKDAVYYNSLAYALLDENDAGVYAKDLLVKICKFPTWLHPWMDKRGYHIYYPIGRMSMNISLGFDLLYGLMDEEEREIVRHAFMKNVIITAHKGYVEDDLVTCNSSNWVAHNMGGSLMCQAVIYGDDPDMGVMEPYFTGALMKYYNFIQNVLDRDGAYGEGYEYYNFALLTLSKSLPAIENVYKVDLSGKLNGSYKELIWAGIVKDKKHFYFGDAEEDFTGGDLHPITNWAWLLPKYKDPLLGWFYNYLKNDETLMDVLYETNNVPKLDPFKENPNRVFKDVGTTVFKSGWEKDDFVFVMRTGPFINHQHFDHGSFWLSDRGSLFIEERHGSDYYKCPLYQSHFIQPIAHSTILIDNNYQSQRAGDPLGFAEGLEDYAFITHFLDGTSAAFASGDIGRLYWGNVKEIKRNVLYLKPRTLLMVDTIVPGGRDVDVTLLYQTQYLKDIAAGDKVSTIAKNGNKLYIMHISPESLEVEAEEMPHFYYTILKKKQLIREGYLAVTGKTCGESLVIANILTSGSGEEPDYKVEKGDGFVMGSVKRIPFAFATRPGFVYEAGEWATDALAMTWDDSQVFAAAFTSLKKDGNVLVKSEAPITCELSANSAKFYHCKEDEVSFGLKTKPNKVFINGREAKEFDYDSKLRLIRIILPAGEGKVEFRND